LLSIYYDLDNADLEKHIIGKMLIVIKNAWIDAHIKIVHQSWNGNSIAQVIAILCVTFLDIRIVYQNVKNQM
jgi:hypothetical protein